MIESIMTLIFIALVFFLFFKLTHIIWKAILFTVLIIILVVGISGFFIYKDIQYIKESDKIIIFQYHEQNVTGITIERLNDVKELTYNELINLKNKDKPFDKYLIININISTIDDMPDGKLTLNNFSITKNDLTASLLSDDPSEFLTHVSSEIVNKSISKDEMIKYKSILASIATKTIIKEKGYKSFLLNNIQTEPNLFVFKIMKLLPSFFSKIIPNAESNIISQ